MVLNEQQALLLIKPHNNILKIGRVHSMMHYTWLIFNDNSGKNDPVLTDNLGFAVAGVTSLRNLSSFTPESFQPSFVSSIKHKIQCYQQNVKDAAIQGKWMVTHTAKIQTDKNIFFATTKPKILNFPECQ